MDKKIIELQMHRIAKIVRHLNNTGKLNMDKAFRLISMLNNKARELNQASSFNNAK